MSQPAARTPEELARLVVARTAPDDVDVLAAVSAEFFTVPEARRRITDAVLSGRRRPAVTAMSPETLSLLVQAVLVIAVGISINIVSGRLDETTGRVRRFWWRRRVRNAIVGPAGAAARTQPVPRYEGADLDAVLAKVDDILVHVGVAADKRSEVTAILRYELSKQPGPLA